MTMPPSDRPLVTVGIPTRNGERTLRYAIRSACAQDYPNLEVVISENASDDATASIASGFSAEDTRVRVIRQSQPLTMLHNHRAVWEAGRGKYFVWLADDDLIGETFVSRCVEAMEARPEAVLAFGELVAFTDYEGMSDAAVWPHVGFGTEGQSRWKRLWKDRHSGYEIKGLFRRDVFEGYGWYDHTVSPDWPLLTYLMLAGEVIEVPDATAYTGSHLPESGADRARTQSFSKVERFPTATLSWRCGLAARDAARTQGQWSWVVLDAAMTFLSLLWVNRRSLVQRAVEPFKARLRDRGTRQPP